MSRAPRTYTFLGNPTVRAVALAIRLPTKAPFRRLSHLSEESISHFRRRAARTTTMPRRTRRQTEIRRLRTASRKITAPVSPAPPAYTLPDLPASFLARIPPLVRLPRNSAGPVTALSRQDWI